MTLRMRVLPRFPAKISNGEGIKISRPAGSTDITVSVDFSSIIRVPSVPDGNKVFFLTWNSDLDTYSTMSFTDTFQAVIDTTGLMLQTVYDPQGKEADAFARENHTGEQPTSSVTGLDAALSGLSTSISALNTALGNRLRFDAAQALSSSQKGQAIANLGVQLLSGTRNKLINGNVRYIVRGPKTIAAGASSYVFDRFLVTNTTNQPVTVSQQAMTPGQVFVPGNPRFKMRFSFASQPTSGTLRVEQRIENVFTMAGKAASARAYLTGPSGSETLACEVVQNFGTGGAPSSAVTTAAASLDIATIYDATTQQRRAQFTIPSVSGKILGTSNDYLALAWMLTPRQAGNYEMARLSFVEGDAYYEDDPFTEFDVSLEKVRCERFCNFHEGNVYSFAGSGTTTVRRINLDFPTTMRAVPNVTWASGDTFAIDERTVSFVRFVTDPGNNTFDGRSVNSVLADAEL